MMKTTHFLAILATVAILSQSFMSCVRDTKTPDDISIHEADTLNSDVFVDVMPLRLQTFHKQLICNGKLHATAKCELTFDNAGSVKDVFVKNGNRVAKGQIIAVTDVTEARLEVEKAKKDMEKSKVELSDHLIGLGYDGISDKVPSDVMNRVKVISGYYTAQYQLKRAYCELQKCSLRAPISGRVANLVNSRGQRVEKLCTIYNDAQLDVDFFVLEAELKNIHRGQCVAVSPFVDENIHCQGVVTSINPTVDDKGLIKVTARIGNQNDRLIDGMNVKVTVENDVRCSFVVPKNAVVSREGYNVVFLYKNGEAIWTYVDIAYSNASSFAITGNKEKDTQLKEGDCVITSGNFNLADGTKVKLRK